MANPAPKGQVFKGWEIDGQIVSEESSYSFDFSDGTVVTALYEPKGLSIGGIIAIVTACVAGCLAIAFITLGILRRKKRAVTEGASTLQEKIYPDTSSLTEREKQVLELLLQGKKRSEIATKLFVSEETIKKQITSIYGKLDVSSRSELFALFK